MFAGPRLPDGFVCEALILVLDTVVFVAVEEMLQAVLLGLPDEVAMLLWVDTGGVALLEDAFVADEEFPNVSLVDPPEVVAMLFCVDTGGVGLLEELADAFAADDFVTSLPVDPPDLTKSNV